jgi:translation elongation factor EF-4
VLQAVIDRLPSPRAALGDPGGNVLARIVDSWYDEQRGMIILAQIYAGMLQEGQRIITYASSRENVDMFTKADFSVQEVGILTPEALRSK